MIYSLNSFVKKQEIGNKAFMLMDLLRSNYNVPFGFVIQKNLINSKKDLKKYKNKIASYFEEEISSFPVVVRSSSPHEDNQNLSYAGQFKSILNVNSFEELYTAIIDVAKSGSLNLKHYNNNHKKEGPAIIIQKQIEPKYSGVLFTQNPLSKGFLIEYVSGHLSDMVSGKEKGHRITRVKDLKGNLLKIYKVGKQLENYYGLAQDIEFIIDKKNKLWIVQSRAITKIFKQKQSKKIKRAPHLKKIKGITLSPGFCKGKLQFIYDNLRPEEANKVFKKGNILATYVLFPEFNKVYHKASGVICMVDSITSHPAIITRELGIPCIGDIDISQLSKQSELLIP